MFKTSTKAFTLVELLVTISIIGLLTLIVLVVVKDKTPKADIAKTMQWSRSIESLLGAYAVGIWNFDEGTGTTAADLSGYGNDGTLMNNPTWRCAEDDSSYTPSGHGCALEFDGVGSYVDIPHNEVFNITDKITIGAWLYIEPKESYPDFQVPATKYWSTSWELSIKEGTQLRFGLAIDGTRYNPDIEGLIPGEWQNVFLAYDGTIIRRYIDSIEIDGANLVSGNIGTNSQDIIFSHSSYKFTGMLDDVRIYGTTLTSAQVEALYYVGLDNLYNKGKITKQEYQKRLLAKGF